MTLALDGSPSGRVAIVTGGSRGVGRATVCRLTASGYAAVVNYLHDQHAAESTVEAILADAGVAVAVRADVADDLDVQRLFAETTAAFGGIDVVVHAVGSPVATARVAEADLDAFDALVRISTRATFIVNREAARHLRNGGAIVNVTSSAGDLARTAHRLYTAARAFTDVLTRALAIELRERDITVNAVCTEADTPCAPSQVAGVVAYLLSDTGRRLTGQVLRADDSRPQPPPESV